MQLVENADDGQVWCNAWISDVAKAIYRKRLNNDIH